MKLRAGSRAVLAGLLVVLVGMALVLRALTTALPPDVRSARSAEPTGRLAAALVLEELGFAPRRFERAPIGLPSGGGLLLVPVPPELPAHLLAAPEEAAGPAREDPRHGLHYRRFVEQGGTLVIAAAPGARAFLERTVGIADPPSARPLGALPAVVRLRGKEPAGVAFRERLARGENPLARAEPGALAVDEQGLVVALRIERGAGAVVLLSSDSFATNAGIAEADHVLLFVRLVEELLEPGAPLLLDEFALGQWSPPTTVSLAFAPRARWVTLHLLLVALLWTWMQAWPREFPRDPAPLWARSPLERARAQAALLERAGRHDLLAERLRAGVLRRLAARARLRSGDLEQAAERGAVLSALLARAPERLRGRAQGLLAGDPVASAAELEELGRELAQLEAALLAEPGFGSALFAGAGGGEDAARARSRR